MRLHPYQVNSDQKSEPEMERQCLDCGHALRGRSDKKFCDDQCRSSYNNRINAEPSSVIRPVNNILRKNHSILSKLYLRKRIRLKKDDLLRLGFDPEYHTHLHHSQNGNTYYFCYDYGYMKLENEMFLIIREIDKE
jgi:hypothetical protein